MGGVADFGGNWWDLAVPVLLLFMMISMGTELTLADFARVVEMPKAVLVGLVGQLVVLPLVGLAYASWPGFSPAVAVGIVIIAACPGGATSNIFSYLARANVALSVTLTSLSSVLCFATIPFWIDLGLDAFGSELSGGGQVELPFTATAIQLLVVTLVPIGLGMLFRAQRPELCERIRPRLRRASAILMAVAITVIVGSEWEGVLRDSGPASLAALALVCTMLALAHGAGRAARLEPRDAFTIAIEVGLQNGALATMIVVSILKRPELIVFPGAYALISFLPVAAFTAWMRRGALAEGATR